MSTHKDELKKLKGPDSFQLNVFKFADQIQIYRKPILLALLPVVGIGLAIAGWQWYRGHQQIQLQADLAKIELEHREENDKIEKEREKLHEKMVALTPKTQKADPEKEPPLTPEQEKIQKEMDAMKADHAVSEKKFMDFYKSHSKEAEGLTAALHVVKMHLEDHKAQEAAPLLAEILQHAGKETFDQLYVRMLYAAVLEELEQWDKAVEEVDKAIPFASETFLPEALLVKSRLLFAASKKKEALDSLDVLIAKHETAPEAQKARALKALWK